MSYSNPTITDFQEYFTRDFPYGTDPDTSILTSDIAKAFGQTNMTINQGLFSSQEDYTTCYLWLSAHWLVVDLKASAQGIASQFDWSPTSKSVGSVSESFTIPQRILDNPLYAQYSMTYYGMKYLMLILPNITGQMFFVPGRTLPT